MIELEASGVSGVREAAGWHPQEHGFPDPPRNLVAVDRRRVMRVDDWLHAYVAAGVGEEPPDLPERNRSNTFEPANPAQSELTVAVAEQRFLAEMDVQHDLGPELTHVHCRRGNDQLRWLGLGLIIFARRSGGHLVRSIGLVVDRFIGLLRLRGGTLLVAKLPQQLQRQRRLGKDADGL